MQNIIKYVNENWVDVLMNPFNDELKACLFNYAKALMYKRNFYNQEIADNIAEEIMISTYEKLGPDLEIHGPKKYSAYLLNGVRWSVSRFFYKYMMEEKKKAKEEKNTKN